MGRNSAEATKASLIRAARARLTSWLALFFGLRVFLPVRVVLPAAVAGCFAEVFVVAAAGSVAAGELAEDCPATGSMTKSKDNNPAMPRPGKRRRHVEEKATFMIPL
jgi:hypothetical protein